MEVRFVLASSPAVDVVRLFLFGSQVVMKRYFIAPVIFISLIIRQFETEKNTQEREVSEGESEVNGNRGLPS